MTAKFTRGEMQKNCELLFNETCEVSRADHWLMRSNIPCENNKHSPRMAKELWKGYGKAFLYVHLMNFWESALVFKTLDTLQCFNKF